MSREGKAGRPAADNGFVLPARGWRPRRRSPDPGGRCGPRPAGGGGRGGARDAERAAVGLSSSLLPGRPGGAARFRFAQPPCPKACGERKVAVSCEVAVSCLLFL